MAQPQPSPGPSSPSKKRPPQKGTAQKRSAARLAKLERENCELQKKLCNVRNYLRGFQEGFDEALRLSGLSSLDQPKVIGIFRAADAKGRDFMQRPPSVFAPMAPNLMEVLQ